MKFRTFIVPLAIVASLVLVLGLGLLGSFAWRTPLYLIDRGGQSVPEALKFVPKQSPVVASVLARPDRLAQLWEYLATPKLRQGIREDLKDLERSLLTNTGLVYTRDIQPWLGEEITVAVVSRDLDQDPANGITPGYLVALSCRDGQTARSTLELFWQNRALAGESLTFEDMAGSRLIYARRWDFGDRSSSPSQPDKSQLATALVANRFVLVANHPEVLRQAITAAQAGDGNLWSDRRYQTALKVLPNQRVGLLAVNLSEAGPLLRGEKLGQTKLLALDNLGASQDSVDWGLISLGLTRQGVLADAAWLAPRGQSLQPRHRSLTDWYSLASYLPQQLTLAALGFSLGDLSQPLQPFLSLWGNHALPIQFLDPRLDTLMGTGATQLVVDGADQPYALGLSQASASGPPSWLLVSPASPTFDTTLVELDNLARQQGLGVGRLDILGYPTTVWTRLSLPKGTSKVANPPRAGSTLPVNQPLQVKTEVAGLATQVGRYQVLTTSPEAMEQVLLVDQRQETPPAWTEQLRWFTQPSDSYLHLDWPLVESALRQQVPQFRLWETVANPILRHLRQITLASYGQTEQIQTMGLFLQLSNQA